MLKDFVVEDDSVGILTQRKHVDLHNEFGLEHIHFSLQENMVELGFTRTFFGPTALQTTKLLLQFIEVDWIQISPRILSSKGEVVEIGYKEPSDTNHDWLLTEQQASPEAHFFLRLLGDDEFIRVHARRAKAIAT